MKKILILFFILMPFITTAKIDTLTTLNIELNLSKERVKILEEAISIRDKQLKFRDEQIGTYTGIMMLFSVICGVILMIKLFKDFFD